MANNNNDAPTEEEAYQIMIEIFDDVLDGTSDIGVVEMVHRRTRNDIADGNETLKDRFFQYANHKAGEIMQEGIRDRDPDVMQEAVNMLRQIDNWMQNWQD